MKYVAVPYKIWIERYTKQLALQRHDNPKDISELNNNNNIKNSLEENTEDTGLDGAKNVSDIGTQVPKFSPDEEKEEDKEEDKEEGDVKELQQETPDPETGLKRWTNLSQENGLENNQEKDSTPDLKLDVPFKIKKQYEQGSTSKIKQKKNKKKKQYQSRY